MNSVNFDPVGQVDFDSEDEVDRVSERIREVLAKRGVPIHKQGSELSSFLGVARSTIHRKFKNGGWSAAEIHAIAERWKSSIEELSGTLPGSQTASLTTGATAKVCISGMPESATLQVGPALDESDSCDLVAVNSNGDWYVYTGGAEPPGTQRHSIKALIFSSLPYIRIAILEDDKLAADALADELNEIGGLVISKFNNAKDLLAATQHRLFDAYVIDWLMGGGQTSEAAILTIRSQQESAPIVVTTGAMALQADTEQKLIPFCEKNRIGIIEKKFRAAVLLSHIRRELAAR